MQCVRGLTKCSFVPDEAQDIRIHERESDFRVFDIFITYRYL